MNEKTIKKYLDKYYTPGVKEAVSKMKKDAKQLEKQLEGDPNNIKLAIRCCLNPFCTTVECDFLG